MPQACVQKQRSRRMHSASSRRIPLSHYPALDPDDHAGETISESSRPPATHHLVSVGPSLYNLWCHVGWHLFQMGNVGVHSKIGE